ncbi:MAG: gliding motility-associated C-terminal domain-containing protein [Chitinophagales bacterium]
MVVRLPATQYWGAQPFSITLGNDTSFCFGNSATLTAPAGYTQYLWSNGDTSQGIVVDSSSTYSVTVTNAAGCTASDAVNITVFANPVIQLPTDTSMFENNPIKLVPVISSGATGTFVWTPNEAISCTDCAQPEVNPTDSITYTLNYTDVHNCTASATIHVRVMNDAEISMPTAFSPNGDGVNDILRPLGFNVKSIRWKVFNRWGELVFQTNEWNTGWDGTFKTVEQPLGVYVYTIEATFMNKKVKHYNGNVTLVR